MSRCPICEKPTVHEFRPFCSLRCADLDLGKWLTGRYAIPAADTDEEDDDAPVVPRGGDE